MLDPKMLSEINMPSAKIIVSTAASLAASAMVIRSVARDLVPDDLKYYFTSTIKKFFKSFSNQLTLVIEDHDGLSSNQMYEAASMYLGTKISPSTRRLIVRMPVKENKMYFSVASNQELIDVSDGVKFKWRQVTRHVEYQPYQGYPGRPSPSKMEIRYLEVSFHRKYKDMVVEKYFPHILQSSKRVKEEKKTLKIHTLNNDQMRRYTGAAAWTPMSLDHPATFNTIAMEPSLKSTIMEDLKRFVERKEYYRRVGKAWKRGYLLYGPPGTGKSSLVAAMANYLNFDIYDLQLTDVSANSELRRLLISTANQSILVVEDIDCSIDLDDQQVQVLPNPEAQIQTSARTRLKKDRDQPQVTLSGLLNFTDGLWSSCGDERIIIFTTNKKHKLDPALLRPGRMDMHIHMSYCTPRGFEILANNYLRITNHSLFTEIEDLIEKINVTPAELAEQLLKHDDADIVLGGVIRFLEAKAREIEEMKVKKRTREMMGAPEKTEED